MLTGRGWWCLFGVALVLLIGLLASAPVLTLVGLACLLWFLWEWVSFVGAGGVVRRLQIRREVCDSRGPVHTLWVGRTFQVRLVLAVGHRWDRLAYVVAADPVPFGVEAGEGETGASGPLHARQELTWEYTVRCPRVGVARFEGVRIETSDVHGFFYQVRFLRAPVLLPILPVVFPNQGHTGGIKQHNQLLPPGIHRLRSPGSGSELLELRDYQPGDPPRTIAWKVSARRDRLITRDYESEVPVRCTLFLDTSSSVRLPSPLPDQLGPGKPIDRLVELGAAVLQAATEVRDLVGLCLFDEQQATLVRPARGRAHMMSLLHHFADAAGLFPAPGTSDPQSLTPLAYALAQDLYPELLRTEVNSLPWGLVWWSVFPGTQRWRGLFDFLYRRKRLLLIVWTALVPLALFLLVVLALLSGQVPDQVKPWVILLWVLGTPAASLFGWLLFVVTILAGGRRRRFARWRKRLSAILSVRYDLAPGGLALLLEDDDAYTGLLQRFLGEHQVPFGVPLYDENGRYSFACPEKIAVLSRYLLRAVGQGRDNELFVLLVDLLELDEHLTPLLEAVRVARARHHQVIVVCPWPPGLPPGRTAQEGRPDGPGSPSYEQIASQGALPTLVRSVTQRRFESALVRIRRTFARLGVPVVCAAGDEAVPLILERMNQLRVARRR
jgi:uncharacterized protein (DUF58 family)